MRRKVRGGGGTTWVGKCQHVFGKQRSIMIYAKWERKLMLMHEARGVCTTNLKCYKIYNKI